MPDLSLHGHKVAKRLALAILALSLAVYLGWWAREQAAIDTCLDKGGTWGRPGLCYGATAYQIDG